MNTIFNPQMKESFWRSRQYLDFISTKPCVRCGRFNPIADGQADPRNDPHHERALGVGGTAIKPPDSHAVPLDHDCHVLRGGWRGPVFHYEIIGTFRRDDESFYPENVDLKMIVIGYLTEFIMEKRYGMQKK